MIWLLCEVMSLLTTCGQTENNPSLNNKHFLADGVLSAKAIKVDDHWRISELKNRVIWRTGDGMKEILNFARSND